jgi:hypothetical protein
MVQYIKQFQDVNEFADLVNGAIRSGGTSQVSPAEKMFGLHGLTLIFTTPTLTITFSDATNAGLSMTDIVTQIAAAGTAPNKVVPKLRGQRVLALWNTVDGNNVVLANTGTANTLFGFSTTVATSGKVYAPFNGTKPRWLDFSISQGLDRYTLIVEE